MSWRKVFECFSFFFQRKHRSLLTPHESGLDMFNNFCVVLLFFEAAMFIGLGVVNVINVGFAMLPIWRFWPVCGDTVVSNDSRVVFGWLPSHFACSSIRHRIFGKTKKVSIQKRFNFIDGFVWGLFSPIIKMFIVIQASSNQFVSLSIHFSAVKPVLGCRRSSQILTKQFPKLPTHPNYPQSRPQKKSKRRSSGQMLNQMR